MADSWRDSCRDARIYYERRKAEIERLIYNAEDVWRTGAWSDLILQIREEARFVKTCSVGAALLFEFMVNRAATHLMADRMDRRGDKELDARAAALRSQVRLATNGLFSLVNAVHFTDEEREILLDSAG